MGLTGGEEVMKHRIVDFNFNTYIGYILSVALHIGSSGGLARDRGCRGIAVQGPCPQLP